MLPLLFIVLGAVAVAAVLAASWQSLRAAFGVAGAGVLRATLGSVERTVLEDEKSALLRSIKDLQFEHDIGKISEQDFAPLDKSLRQRAREILRLLDEDILPHRAEAERVVREHLQKEMGSTPYRDQARDVETARCPGCNTLNDMDADWCKSCATRLGPRSCAECHTVNDADAAFCKKCAHRFEEETPEEGAEGDAEAEPTEDGELSEEHASGGDDGDADDGAGDEGDSGDADDEGDADDGDDATDGDEADDGEDPGGSDDAGDTDEAGDAGQKEKS